jgi:hypothetical protein
MAMAPRISICDQVNLDRTAPVFDLSFLDERIPLRELIRSRVHQEVKDFNAEHPEHFRGPVQPTDTERTSNGFRFQSKGRAIDWKVQFELALTAFEAGGFLVLVDDKQVTDLDAEINLTMATEAVFLKLVPLVGG